MQISTEWRPAHVAWVEFTEVYPYLGFGSGRWQFHNFLRNHKDLLVQVDAIRKAKGKFWIAHRERFLSAAFDCATGFKGLSTPIEACPHVALQGSTE